MVRLIELSALQISGSHEGIHRKGSTWTASGPLSLVCGLALEIIPGFYQQPVRTGNRQTMVF